jgi:hypothetical protein
MFLHTDMRGAFRLVEPEGYEWSAAGRDVHDCPAEPASRYPRNKRKNPRLARGLFGSLLMQTQI